ncbi:hypothetical protein [Gordonia zhaorongruii]|uniref:hypothetical protein n=1 Tax=Gordonia zhaorongruii TaxID=2597659 RepID=UPI0010525AE2|nr:hypothetical protein [Gordonia zhaorongruii]
MTNAAQELADRLLDAQVDFVCRQLTDRETFTELAREEITGFLDDASKMTLSEAVTRDMIKDVAYKYAIAFPVEGAIPELVGEIAARLFSQSATDEIRLEDIIERKHFDDLVSGISGLAVTRRLLDRVLDSPTAVDTCVEAVQRAVDASRFPSRVGRFVDDAVAAVTRRGTRFVLDANRSESDDIFEGAARDFWRAHNDQRVSEVQQIVDDGDIEDIVVLVFEFWRTFRETEYFSTLLAEGVDGVFDAYGDTDLATLLSELGIEYDDLLEEALRFGPTVIAEIDRRGFLEKATRRRLAPFYASAEFEAAVGGAATR